MLKSHFEEMFPYNVIDQHSPTKTTIERIQRVKLTIYMPTSQPVFKRGRKS